MQNDDHRDKRLRSLAEEYRVMLESRPDANTLAYFAKLNREALMAIEGCTRIVNICIASERDHELRLKEIFDIVTNSITPEILKLSEDIGRVQSETTLCIAAQERMDARFELLGKWAAAIEAWAVKQGKPPQPKENPSAGQN
jgi:hypothetical protein